VKKLPVKISTIAQNQYLQILDYLSSKWNEIVCQDFKLLVDNKITQISFFPNSCKVSKKNKGIYQAVLNKHASFYYRINNNVIEILIFIDNRSNPSKKDELLKTY
jgi:glutathionyl-hydroquinone reductase